MAGWQVVALEPYGGAWLNSWLDRDLGLSGRISMRDGKSSSGLADRLVRFDEPLLRVPQLAIHLAEDRKTLTLDLSGTLTPYGALGSGLGHCSLMWQTGPG